jgi:hypothetical protein
MDYQETYKGHDIYLDWTEDDTALLVEIINKETNKIVWKSRPLHAPRRVVMMAAQEVIDNMAIRKTGTEKTETIIDWYKS